MKNKQPGKSSIEKKVVADLFEENNDALFRYAYRYLGDQDLAEECVGDVFMRFLKRIQNDGFADDNFKAYLYRSAHNWIVDYYRSRNGHESVENISIPDPASNVEENVARKMKIEKLRIALMQLPDDQRMLIELRFLEDWSHEQISDFLGKTTSATRALQYRTMIVLREALSIE